MQQKTTSIFIQKISTLVSLSIVLIALYGDILKRVLPASVVLAVLYGMVLTLIFVMVTSNQFKSKQPLTNISILAIILIGIYLAQIMQFFADPTINLLNSVSLALYIAIPVSFFYVIPTRFQQFNLRKFAFFILIFSIPIHIVGIIQYFIDPLFFVSTAYNEAGGMIIRNFLAKTDDGFSSFLRYPAIFVSADRYSGVSMVQIISSLFLVFGQPQAKKSDYRLLYASLILGLVGMTIAGARSRFVAIILALIVISIPLAKKYGRSFLKKNTFMRPTKGALLIIIASLLLLLAAGFTGFVNQQLESMPLLIMLEQSSNSSGNNFTLRLIEALGQAIIPDDISMFGSGLGSDANGRPGEMAARAMWVEGGIFWTILKLTFFLLMLFIFIIKAMSFIRSENFIAAYAVTCFAINWLMGLLAGLSHNLELSQAILFIPIIAFLMIDKRSKIDPETNITRQ